MKITHVHLLQGALCDRFYNLLPFMSKMPRNHFYADLSSQVAGRCLDLSGRLGIVAATDEQPNSVGGG